MNYLWIILLLILSYLIGSIPNGLIVGKLFKKTDIREHSSKNIGATNSARVLGVKLGALVLLLDMLKGAIIPGILHILMLNHVSGIEVIAHIGSIEIIAIYGLAAALGHVFPIYINFHGGKAVATSLGVICALNPWIGLIAIVIFAGVVIITKHASVGSIVSGAVSIVLIVVDVGIWKVFGVETTSFSTHYVRIIVVSLLLIIILVRHKENIKRLINKTENKLDFKK